MAYSSYHAAVNVAVVGVCKYIWRERNSRE